MKSLLLLCAIALTSTLYAQVNQQLPTKEWAYYGEQFYTKLKQRTSFNKDELNKILTSVHLTSKGRFDTFTSTCDKGGCYSHTAVTYDQARMYMFGQFDRQKDDRGAHVVDVYCHKKFYFNNPKDASNMGSQVNIEHTWPQSKFNGSIDKSVQKSDMHHLYLTDSLANSRRGNHDFGDTRNNVDELNVENCDISKLAEVDGRTLFMPPVGHRGNVARSLFYFSVRYKLQINPEQEKILRQWHKEDPIDENEFLRHDSVTKVQQNRNPFVDHPEMVDLISDF
ncbi:MAG: endonuclease I family protein [Bacteriovoracaceae bacterium]